MLKVDLLTGETTSKTERMPAVNERQRVFKAVIVLHGIKSLSVAANRKASQNRDGWRDIVIRRGVDSERSKRQGRSRSSGN